MSHTILNTILAKKAPRADGPDAMDAEVAFQFSLQYNNAAQIPLQVFAPVFLAEGANRLSAKTSFHFLVGLG